MLQRFRDYRMGEIGVCSVVAAELAHGVAKSGSAKNRQALDLFLAPLVILPFDEAALCAYGDLRTDRRPCPEPAGHAGDQQPQGIRAGVGASTRQLASQHLATNPLDTLARSPRQRCDPREDVTQTIPYRIGAS